MTPIHKLRRNDDLHAADRSINLKAAYAILLRSYLRRHAARIEAWRENPPPLP
ncbi:MAG: hypothetical protein R2867_02825 [Caldilineaceae bacterium]